MQYWDVLEVQDRLVASLTKVGFKGHAFLRRCTGTAPALPAGEKPFCAMCWSLSHGTSYCMAWAKQHYNSSLIASQFADDLCVQDLMSLRAQAIPKACVSGDLKSGTH